MAVGSEHGRCWDDGYSRNVRDHVEVQCIAREAMQVAKATIRAGQNLQEVRTLCEDALLRLGADDFWYWDIGAFVFAGEDTVLSVSGRDYETADRVIQEDDIVTIDLSPRKDGLWGDFARTLILEGGAVIDDPLAARNRNWRDGLRAQRNLHATLIEVAEPAMTFDELHRRMNAHIRELGFENLDFMGNLGHSIELRTEDRIYAEAGNTAPLDSVECFTFEPHIRCLDDGEYGFKHEDIYRFQRRRLVAV